MSVSKQLGLPSMLSVAGAGHQVLLVRVEAYEGSNEPNVEALGPKSRRDLKRISNFCYL